MSTKERTKHLDQLHFEHKLWASAASLYSDELNIFRHRLEEVAERNSSADFRKKVEHFQNQFILQQEQLDTLRHIIRSHEQSLMRAAREHPVAIDHALFIDHTALHEQSETFSRLFRILKSEFITFLEQWL